MSRADPASFVPEPPDRGSDRDQARRLAELRSQLLRAVRSKWRDVDAEDLVQEAFLRLWMAERRATVRNPGALLRIIAGNLIRDRIRAEATRRDYSEDATWQSALPCDHPGPERALAARERLAAVDAAIAELPPSARTAFMLCRVDRLPQAMIADQLQISVSMVEKHVRRAVASCRMRLDAIDTD